MQISVGYELIYRFPQPTPMILMLSVHYSRASDLRKPDLIRTIPSVPISMYRDGFGNWCTRIVAPAGSIRLTADALIDDDGVLELKCPTTAVHMKYVMGGEIPKDYVPQVAWELACTGRAYVDFVSYGVGIVDDDMRFFYRRRGRDELEYSYTDYSGATDREILLTGEAVIAYFTDEVLKMEAEIQEFLKGRQTVAPFDVKMKP